MLRKKYPSANSLRVCHLVLLKMPKCEKNLLEYYTCPELGNYTGVYQLVLKLPEISVTYVDD